MLWLVRPDKSACDGCVALLSFAHISPSDKMRILEARFCVTEWGAIYRCYAPTCGL